MQTTKKVTVRSATKMDQKQLASLIHFETYVHRHLDWRPPLEWIEYEPFLVAELDQKIIGALACPPDPPSVAWIRLFATAATYSLKPNWDMLWKEARYRLGGFENVKSVAAIPLWHWFTSLLRSSGFKETYRVVMLTWDRGSKLPILPPTDAVLRPMCIDDLERVHQIDSAAFMPVWRNSIDALELAYRQAAVATVAELDDRMVGYQISTSTPMGGHLARLAVLPELQGRNIGFSLVCDALQQFDRRGAQRVTVNTQTDNIVSLALYRKAGFKTSAEEYPIYQLSVHP